VDEIQLDLFLDYASNVELYPAFQFREHRPKFLAIWGRHDPFFLPPGAEAYRRDLPDAEIRFLALGILRWRRTRRRSRMQSRIFSIPQAPEGTGPRAPSPISAERVARLAEKNPCFSQANVTMEIAAMEA
jgi:hypothetical protein